MNFFLKSIVVLGLFVFVTGFSGCDQNAQMRTWIDHIHELKETTKKESEVTPYRSKQYHAITQYFSELRQMALAIKKDRYLAQRFNVAVVQLKFTESCSKVFLARVEWQRIVDHCTKNRFFLCSEEVRAYPDVVTTLKSRLTPELRKWFDETPACKDAIIF